MLQTPEKLHYDTKRFEINSEEDELESQFQYDDDMDMDS
jgi:hypothetical protein